MARLELRDTGERRGRRGDVPDLEIHVERVPIERAVRQARRVQGLQLGRERDAPGPGGDVQRLDPEAVAGEQQRPRLGVPDREGKHAPQPCDALGAFLLVQMQDGFRVALGGVWPRATRPRRSSA